MAGRRYYMQTLAGSAKKIYLKERYEDRGCWRSDRQRKLDWVPEAAHSGNRTHNHSGWNRQSVARQCDSVVDERVVLAAWCFFDSTCYESFRHDDRRSHWRKAWRSHRSTHCTPDERSFIRRADPVDLHCERSGDVERASILCRFGTRRRDAERCGARFRVRATPAKAIRRYLNHRLHTAGWDACRTIIGSCYSNLRMAKSLRTGGNCSSHPGAALV